MGGVRRTHEVMGLDNKKGDQLRRKDMHGSSMKATTQRPRIWTMTLKSWRRGRRNSWAQKMKTIREFGLKEQ